MRTVHVTITANLIIQMDDGIELSEVMDSIEIRPEDWTPKGCTESFTLVDANITNHEVTDSR